MGDFTMVDGEIADGRSADDAPARLDRVFVGIPDVLTREQFARLNGLSMSEKSLRFSKADEGVDMVEAHIAAAERFTQYILHGAK